MAETIKILDGEGVIETARIEVYMIGSGAIVTATLIEEDGTAIIAGSEILPVLDDLKQASDAGTRLMVSLKGQLNASVTEETPELIPGTQDALDKLTIRTSDLLSEGD